MTRPEGGPATARVRWRWIFRIIATFATLALIAWWLPVDQLWAAIRSVPAVTWPSAIAVYLAAHLLGVVKWRLLVNAAGAALPARQAAHAYYLGLFGNLFLPSIVGGDVVRAGVVMRRSRSPSALLLGSLVDRVQDVIGLGLLAALGAFAAPRALDETSLRIFRSVAVLAGVAGAVALISLRVFPARLVPFSVRRVLVRARRAVRAMASRPGALVMAFSLGLVLQSGFVLLNRELGRLIGIDSPLYVWFFVWPLAKLAGLAPLTQGGIGVREAALAALFAPFGVTAVKAVATGLIFEGVIVTGGVIAGALAAALHQPDPSGGSGISSTVNGTVTP